MKNSDIATLGKALLALEKYLPLSEKAIFDEFSVVYESLAAKNQKEKQAYQDKAEYHREYARSWREENPEKQKQYAQSHYQKKKQQAKQQSDNAGETPSMLAKLRKNQEFVQNKAAANDSKVIRSLSNGKEHR